MSGRLGLVFVGLMVLVGCGGPLNWHVELKPQTAVGFAGGPVVIDVVDELRGLPGQNALTVKGPGVDTSLPLTMVTPTHWQATFNVPANAEVAAHSFLLSLKVGVGYTDARIVAETWVVQPGIDTPPRPNVR